MRSFVALSALAVLAAACSVSTSDGPAPSPADAEVSGAGPGSARSKLTTVPCRFFAPRSVEGKTFHCADLEVPEDRRAADSKTIKIHVAIIKGKEGGIPTIELNGGPGGGADMLVGALAAKDESIMRDMGRFLEQGDIVLFDQRGVGRSIPRLGCSYEQPDPALCAKTLAAKGINLAAYDTAENAEDVHDLKVALGAEKVDLHGISYGTRLALEAMKRHPDDVRAAIIDGVMPADVPVIGQFRVALDGVLSSVFAACKADSKCSATFGDLEAKLEQLKARLNQTPFTLPDPYGDHEHDQRYDFDAFIGELIQQGYVEGTHGMIPLMITDYLTMTQEQFVKEQQALSGDGRPPPSSNPLMQEVDALIDAATEEDFASLDMAQGMYLSVTCNDYAQHEREEDALVLVQGIRPALQAKWELEAEFGDCAAWPKRPSDPVLRKPTTFAGPVLVIGGDLDAATPSSWAKHASAALPNDQLVVVPTGGHGLMDSCGMDLKTSFFSDPSKPLDPACATKRSIEFAYAEPTQGALHGALAGRGRTPLAFRPAKSLAAALADRVLAGSVAHTPTTKKMLDLVKKHRH